MSTLGQQPTRPRRFAQLVSAALLHHTPSREALLHESSPARTMPTDRILTCRCDTTLVGRGRSSDSEWRSRDVDDERREPHRNLGVDKAERLQDLGARGQAGAGHRRHPWRCAWLFGGGVAGSTEAAGSRARGPAVGLTSGGAGTRRLMLIAG